MDDHIFEDILKRRDIEFQFPGTVPRVDLIQDVNYLVNEIHSLDAEILVLKDLLSNQAGFE